MKAPILVLLMTCAATASAADHGFYAGAGWSSVSGDYAPDERGATIASASAADIPFGPIDTGRLEPLGSSAWQLLAGYRVLDWLAVEGNVSRFQGNSAFTGILCVTVPCPARESAEVRSSSLSLLALYPRGPLDFFVRAGVTRWNADIDYSNFDGSHMDTDRGNGTDPNYGVGAQYNVAHFVTRLEYERVEFGDDAGDLVTLGFAYTF
jgi:hypothetical protein